MKSLHDRIRSAIEKIDRSDLIGGDVEKSIRLDQRLKEEVLSSSTYISNLDKISTPNILASGSVEKQSSDGYRLINLASQARLTINDMPDELFENKIVWSGATRQIKYFCELFEQTHSAESTLVVFPIIAADDREDSDTWIMLLMDSPVTNETKKTINRFVSIVLRNYVTS